MAAPGCRRLWLACVALTLTADCAAVTAADVPTVTTVTPNRTPQTGSDLYGSRVAAILAPCLVALAIAVMLGLTLAAAKVRERRQMEGGFSPRQLEETEGRAAPEVLGATSLNTLTARVERLLRAEGLTSDLLLGVSLLSVALLLVLVLTVAGLLVALNRRATRGTYSPSRQEKEGSRVEMWSITQPPLMERLI